MRILDVDDGFTSETDPSITGATANKLENFANDAAFVTANGTAAEGAIYHNTTSKETRKFDGTDWTVVGSYEVTANQDVTSDGTIAINSSGLQALKVSGDSGAQTANIVPFASNPPITGTIIKLIGQSDTNTVEILSNSAANGAKLKGDITLGNGNSLTLFWDGTNYLEQGRV